MGLIAGAETLFREEIKATTEKEKRIKLIIFGTYLVISYLKLLRVNEGLILDLSR